MRPIIFLGLAACLSLAACKPSPYVQTTVTNASGDSLQQVEIDYPSASFGKDKLPDNGVFNYRFKIQGSGKAHLEFLDSKGKSHAADGPELQEGQSGTLEVRITPAYSVSWLPQLHDR